MSRSGQKRGRENAFHLLTAEPLIRYFRRFDSSLSDATTKLRESRRRAARASDAVTIGKLKFEAALAELEQLVQDMEGGRLPLEESLAAYRRGSELLTHCQQQLSNAEAQIQVLENGALRAFEPTGGEAK